MSLRPSRGRGAKGLLGGSVDGRTDGRTAVSTPRSRANPQCPSLQRVSRAGHARGGDGCPVPLSPPSGASRGSPADGSAEARTAAGSVVSWSCSPQPRRLPPALLAFSRAAWHRRAGSSGFGEMLHPARPRVGRGGSGRGAVLGVVRAAGEEPWHRGAPPAAAGLARDAHRVLLAHLLRPCRAPRVGFSAAAGQRSRRSCEQRHAALPVPVPPLPAALPRAGSGSNVLLRSPADPVLNLITPIALSRQERKTFTT